MPIYKVEGAVKNGKQKYRVIVNYKDEQGKYKKVERTAYGSREAKELEKILEESINSSKNVTDLTVKQLFQRYISDVRHDIRASTLDKTEQHMELHVIPYLGDVKLNDLDLINLQDWKNTINQKSPDKKGKENQRLSLNTRQHIYGSFRTVLNYGVKMGFLHTNPLTKVGNFKDPYITKKEMDFYTIDEFNLFIAEARKRVEMNNDINDWHYYIFFMLAFYTGMRKGEINALKWSDIDGDVIHVRRSVWQKIKGDEDHFSPPKNSYSQRDIKIPQVLKTVLDEYKELCNQLHLFSEDWFVCGGQRCLRDTTIEKRNAAYAKSAGIKRIRIHDFRHSHASLLANAGINIQEVARRLGHSDVEMTWNTYSHLYPKEEDHAVAVLDAVARGTKRKIKIRGKIVGATKNKSGKSL